MDKIIEKWDEILNTVKQEYEISDVSFDTWIRPLEVFAIEGNTLYILVPSEQMALSYISKKYLAPLRVAIVEITEIEYEIKFSISPITSGSSRRHSRSCTMLPRKNRFPLMIRGYRSSTNILSSSILPLPCLPTAIFPL